MSTPATVRATIAALGQPVTWTPHGGQPVTDVPALITDQPEGRTEVSGRSQRVAQIRVSKSDVPAIGYRDTFTEADGTVWSVVGEGRVINDRRAGTWRAVVETAVKVQIR